VGTSIEGRIDGKARPVERMTHNGQVEGYVIQVMVEISLDPMKLGVPYVGEFDKILNEIRRAGATYLPRRKLS